MFVLDPDASACMLCKAGSGSALLGEMSMSETDLLQRILRRLEVLIALQLEPSGGDKPTRLAFKIRRLAELGVAPSEIASIVGKSTNYITATLSRKSGRKRRAE